MSHFTKMIYADKKDIVIQCSVCEIQYEPCLPIRDICHDFIP